VLSTQQAIQGGFADSKVTHQLLHFLAIRYWAHQIRQGSPQLLWATLCTTLTQLT